MECLSALRMIAVMTILTGVIYPLGVTAISQVAFKDQANGSLILREGRPVGSALLAQRFESPRYFWPRPSVGDYATVASGASNKGPTAADLQQTIQARRSALRIAHSLPPDAPVPDELVTASGSGLDPHISPEAARFQIQRVAKARELNAQYLEDRIQLLTKGRQFGLLGEPRVNVLQLNLELDRLAGGTR
ncbi:MAG: potassium-transporting ATPase subunit C [Candidatus Melainabacteria bacterium HGW-Melainabacteria-1]|nr:MAG: potassium-transporting ATPase subunit C [Candidatus Melainabacteria bacterium HGW-Melainabacteria-1]